MLGAQEARHAEEPKLRKRRRSPVEVVDLSEGNNIIHTFPSILPPRITWFFKFEPHMFFQCASQLLLNILL